MTFWYITAWVIGSYLAAWTIARSIVWLTEGDEDIRKLVRWPLVLAPTAVGLWLMVVLGLVTSYFMLRERWPRLPRLRKYADWLFRKIGV